LDACFRGPEEPGVSELYIGIEKNLERVRFEGSKRFFEGTSRV
jgi:hypothetical protein